MARPRHLPLAAAVGYLDDRLGEVSQSVKAPLPQRASACIDRQAAARRPMTLTEECQALSSREKSHPLKPRNHQDTETVVELRRIDGVGLKAGHVPKAVVRFGWRLPTCPLESSARRSGRYASKLQNL
jgi:hypothetical protein